MVDDLARAFDFVRRADMVGSREEPCRWGTAVFAPELPLRHDSNYLLADRLTEDADAGALAREADRLQGPAGLGHRCVMLHDAGAGERLAPGFEALGWKTFRGVLMAHRRSPERWVDTSEVVETDAEALRAARERHVLSYPWGTPEVARQVLGARALFPVPTRDYAVFVDGEPVSWVECTRDGAVAQVEALATVEAHRGRGHASRVLLRAVEDARRAGADLVFLCADASDWPQRLYGRLGFDEIGRYAKFTRSRA
jgi:ribosomal protein S18 acetylase RimI-like enzyme